MTNGLFRFWVFPDCTFLDISKLAKRRQSQYAKQIEFCVADATDRKSILELKRNRYRVPIQMRSRYPRNHISEDHYPIKRVVVFFLFTQGSKKYLSSDTLSKIARKTRFCRTHTSVMVYKSFLIDHHFCIFRGIFALF